MTQAVFSVQDLSERWKAHENTIRRMEEEGKLHRLKNLPGVKYSAKEVLQLESVGLDAKPLTAWERKRLLDEIADLRKELVETRRRLLKAQQVLQGFES